MDDNSIGKVIPSWLGCPVCQGPLTQQESAFYCPSHNLSFPEVNGILRLLPPEKVVEAEAFAIEYRRQRENQDWRRLSANEMIALPEKGPRDWDKLYWQVRRQSFRQLENRLKAGGRYEKPHRIIDMGAGIGWLAARFAADDHDVVALDLSDDDAFGLGAALRLKQALNLNLTLVQGAIEDPPFQRQQVDLLVYNAILHYASDINYCLASGVGLLRPGGALIIMDSPVVDKKPVTDWHWGGGRKLEKGRLLAALESAGLNYKYVTIQRTIGWRWRQLKTKLRGDLPFDFPLIIARLD
jgi:SAM-dependent methyltransferase